MQTGSLRRWWIGVSGFYDIEPFRQTHFHELVGFSDDEYLRFNPMRIASEGRVPPPGLLITGEKESPLLHEMMEHYYGIIRQQGGEATTLTVKDTCHFSVLASLGDPDSVAFRAALSWLRGADGGAEGG